MSGFLLNPFILSTIGIPNGSTVTPVDDYTIWLACAEISNTYGSLAAVIADSTAKSTLCNNKNALRYMVRSMSTIIPAVFANAGWVTALGVSTYATVVPIMTSDTAPSGTASASSVYSAGAEAFRAFMRDAAQYWAPTNYEALNSRISYEFPQNVYIYKVVYTNYSNATFNGRAFKFQGYKDAAWDDLATVTPVSTANVVTTTLITDLIDCPKYGLLFTTSGNVVVRQLQFYGLNLTE